MYHSGGGVDREGGCVCLEGWDGIYRNSLLSTQLCCELKSTLNKKVLKNFTPFKKMGEIVSEGDIKKPCTSLLSSPWKKTGVDKKNQDTCVSIRITLNCFFNYNLFLTHLLKNLR